MEKSKAIYCKIETSLAIFLHFRKLKPISKKQ